MRPRWSLRCSNWLPVPLSDGKSPCRTPRASTTPLYVSAFRNTIKQKNMPHIQKLMSPHAACDVTIIYPGHPSCARTIYHVLPDLLGAAQAWLGASGNRMRQWVKSLLSNT